MPLFYGEKGDPSVRRTGYFGTPGSLGPSLKETEYLPTHVFDDMARWFAAAREAIGWEFELMMDCHGRLNLPNAVRLVEALAPYRLMFIEEPLPPESADEFGRLAARSTTPIASGERLVSLWDVRPYLERGALGVLQCDVVNCGGFTGARKIAAMAEAYYVPLAPHNPNGPIATLAAAHFLASIPNALILETVGSDADLAMFGEIVDRPPRIERGILALDDRPGIGASLLPDVTDRRPAGISRCGAPRTGRPWPPRRQRPSEEEWCPAARRRSRGGSPRRPPRRTAVRSPSRRDRRGSPRRRPGRRAGRCPRHGRDAPRRGEPPPRCRRTRLRR
jgi:galactonate dehydratase